MHRYRILSEERLYEGRVFRVRRDELEHASGYRTMREIVEHDGGAVIAALFPNRDILLIRQHRWPIDQVIYELPAGKLDPGEDPRDCALRELEEETGWKAGSLVPLTSIFTTPGFCSEQLHLFLATDLAPGTQALEPGEESIRVERVPLDHAVAMVRSGEIRDAKTIVGILMTINNEQ